MLNLIWIIVPSLKDPLKILLFLSFSERNQKELEHRSMKVSFLRHERLRFLDRTNQVFSLKSQFSLNRFLQ